MSDEEIRAVCLLGPTASGKTELALRLCDHMRDHIDAEIISVDSVQIYRGLDIGSAKPDPETRRRYTHHLIDIREPTETYSAAQFCEDAYELVRDINARGKLPLLVGGTMFYFHAFEHGLDELPPGDATVRNEIDALCESRGLAYLYDELKRVDADTAKTLDPNDAQRIKRALEVYQISGAPMSALYSKNDKDNNARPRAVKLLKLAIDWRNRAQLHQRIEKRFLTMLDNGFRDEVRDLMLLDGLDANSTSIRVAGYRQMWQYLSGQLNWREMTDAGVSSHRQLAKRQLTWMRSMENLQRYYADEQSVNDIAAAMRERVTCEVKPGQVSDTL